MRKDINILNFGAGVGVVREVFGVSEVPAAPPSVNHVFIADISGSMYGDLPELRRHIKNKIISLVGDNDTLSIIWFSGRNQSGVLMEGVPVRSVQDLAEIHSAIDKYLVPIGLTGFVDPLRQAQDVIGRLKSKNPMALTNLVFSTDGQDNQWSQKEILEATRALATKVDSAAVVEYGWYCNRPLLAEMANILGGKLVFSEHFEQYRVALEQEMQGFRAKRVPRQLAAVPNLGYAFTVTEKGEVLTFEANGSEVLVPESVSEIGYFLTADNVKGEVVAKKLDDDMERVVRAGLATLAQRRLTSEIFAVLKGLGDVYMARRFMNCFSKQDYSDFRDYCGTSAVGLAPRYVEGWDQNAVPREDAFTVMDALNAMMEDEGNKLYPRHPNFGYKRIGAASVQKDDSISYKILDAETLGVPVRTLVFNEERPNVSVSVRMNVMVTLPADHKKYGLPAEIPSFIHRSYTVIRDGIVHTRILPVSLTQDTFNLFQKEGLLKGEVWENDKVYMLDVSGLPVINRKMVKTTKAADMFRDVYELEKLKGTQKVFNTYRKAVAPKTSQTYDILYGVEASAWLKEIGVTDYNGYNPPSTAGDFADVYTVKVVNISVAKVSSLPTVKDVEAKMDAGKSLTLREQMLEDGINRVREFKASDIYQKAADKDALLATWLISEQKAATEATRKLMRRLNEAKFALVVGQSWFSDLAEDVNSLTFKADGNDVTVTVSVEDKEIGN